MRGHCQGTYAPCVPKYRNRWCPHVLETKLEPQNPLRSGQIMAILPHYGKGPSSTLSALKVVLSVWKGT